MPRSEAVGKRPKTVLCKALTRAGQPCRAIAGPGGVCTAHRDPARMRELGRRGGKRRRNGAARLPEFARRSLRDALREGLEPELVVATAREVMAGGNQGAKVSAIKLLADLDLYRTPDEQAQAANALSPLFRWFLEQLREAELIRYKILEEDGRTLLEYELYDIEQSLRGTFCTGDDAECFRVERRDGELWVSYDSARFDDSVSDGETRGVRR
jgi:hypothetical protein